MPYGVLIVDDSHFFQSRLKEIIEECPDLKVIGIAENGREAIEKAESLKPDIITMDYEMPYLDGISAVREILSRQSMPIVMFSSMTYEGARITLEALEAGAVDFIPKNFAEVSGKSAQLTRKLHEKLITFVRNSKPRVAERPKLKEPTAEPARPVARRPATPPPRRQQSQVVLGKLRGKVKLLVIGASTGGPVAVADIITHLPANFPVPVVVVQHMPANFTKAFSERLNGVSQVSVKEAESGDMLTPGWVYIAPGGKQLMFENAGPKIKIIDGDNRVNYKPCVDISFASAANVFDDAVLAVVLTGMGHDGLDGARLLKQKKSYVWSQDKESCVVYGMPAAVASANLSDMVLSIKDMATELIRQL